MTRVRSSSGSQTPSAVNNPASEAAGRAADAKTALDRFVGNPQGLSSLRTSSPRGVERILGESPSGDPVRHRLAMRVLLTLMSAHVKNFDPKSGA